jgi:hypothetical protein
MAPQRRHAWRQRPRIQWWISLYFTWSSPLCSTPRSAPQVEQRQGRPAGVVGPALVAAGFDGAGTGADAGRATFRGSMGGRSILFSGDEGARIGAGRRRARGLAALYSFPLSEGPGSGKWMAIFSRQLGASCSQDRRALRSRDALPGSASAQGNKDHQPGKRWSVSPRAAGVQSGPRRTHSLDDSLAHQPFLEGSIGDT